MGAHSPPLGGNSMKRSIAAAVATAIGLILMAAPSTHAQGTINVIGKVVDAQGNPVPDVKVLLDYKGHIVQKYRTKTDKNGVFTHVRVYSGPYRMTLTKDGVGEVSFNANLQEVDSLQQPPEYKFVPKVAAAAPPPPGSGLAPAAAPAAAPVDMGQLTSEINNAIALSKSGDTDGAIAANEAILAKTPEIPLVHYNLGALYKKKGDPARAQSEMEKALDLDPRFVDGYVGLATLLAETGKRAQAIEVIQKGTAANPQSGRLQYALGVLAEGSGDVALAKEAFLKTEQLDPQNFETQYHLATVALNQNNKVEAVARLERFIAQAPPETPAVATAKSLLAALQKK
jgi:tetratricopeptide (TPR) repeat protein